MNLQNIISEIEKVDPEIYERTSTRRDAFKGFAGVSGKIALTALPFAFGSMIQKAYGSPQNATAVLDVLNFALKLEYLEYHFYNKGINTALISTAAVGPGLTALTTIRNHEGDHVTFLKNAILAAGGVPVSFVESDFDFTADGTFPTVFLSYDTFLAVAQALEDTGVRAYKGQAGNLIGAANRTVLTAALNIHSVEARHASHIRQMRKARGADVKPWITGNDTGGIGASVNANYAGEQNVIQVVGSNNITITGINGFSISANAATEAFDEPLTEAEVTTLVTPFFA